ncbi:hypothetical protein KFL_013720010, partial [Klebsormidium nitens]
MKREYPNPVQASRGQNALLPNHFHLAGKVVYFIYWQFFFGELVPIINCPKCGKADKVCSDGWVGVTDKIRRVCAADGPAFLYSKVFRCGKGKKPGEGCPGNGGKPYQFRSHDEGVLSQLPAAVLEQLPIVFTRGGAIERSLLETMVRNVASSASVADQQKMIREAHMRTFTQHKNNYIQYAAARAELQQKRGGALLFPGVQRESPPPADFGEYDDKEGYRGWIPSTSWIAGVILASLNSRLAFLERHLAAVDGVFWRGDHTFQAPSRIRSAEGRKDYAAIYSIMNEWSQIVGQWAVGDTSFDEYVTGVQDVLKRYADLGFQLPKYMWVDNSRTVAAQLYETIPSLSRVLEDATHVMRRIFETIPDAHSLKADFCRDYSNAMFKIHQPDKWALREFLLAGGPGRRKWTQAEVAAKPGSYWRARCRHTIPSAQELVDGVQAVMKKYERGTCAVNGDPLITDEVRGAHELQLQLMQDGLLSDPLKVDEMYILVSAPGCMPRYVGVRGCSSLEGYHRHLNALLGGGNYSPELAGALIALFNYRWNYECAVRNKGAKDWGMFDHWLLEEMQDTCAAMGWPNPCPEWRRAPPTKERFGVHAGPVPVRTTVSEGDVGEEPEFLDQEAMVVETMLEEQQLKSTQAVGAINVLQPGAAPLSRESTPPACSTPPAHASPPQQPAVMRVAPRPGGQPAFPSSPVRDGQPALSSPLFQNGQPAVVRTAPQPEGQPAPSFPAPQDGQLRDVRTAPQPGGQPALSSSPFQNGQPRDDGQPGDVRTATQPEGQPAPCFPPPQNGQLFGVRTATQPEGQPAPSFLAPQDGQPRDVCTAPQHGGQPAPSFLAPQDGQPGDVRTATQPEGQPALSFPLDHDGLPRVVPAAAQPVGQPSHSFPPSLDGLPQVVRTVAQPGGQPAHSSPPFQGGLPSAMRATPPPGGQTSHFFPPSRDVLPSVVHSSNPAGLPEVVHAALRPGAQPVHFPHQDGLPRTTLQVAARVVRREKLDNAIHQKNIPLLKKYEKGLVKEFIRKDSLNALIAHNTASLQHPNYAPSTTINPFVGGIHPYPPTFAHSTP